MTLEEIRARMADVRAELLALADLPELDEQQVARFSELETEYVALEEQERPLAERAALVERVRAAHAASEANREPGVGAGPQVMVRNDPFADLERVRNANLADRAVVNDLRSRALRAIEAAPEHMTDDQRERTERLVRNDRRGRIARHVLLTGSEAYHRAFEELLTHNNPALLEGEEYEAWRHAEAHRAAMSLTDVNGGYLVPFTLDPTIILTNDGSTNPFRRIATIKTITTDTWNGVSSAGVQAEWLAEAQEASDGSPTFAQPTITPKRAGAWIQGSFEFLADSGFAAEVGPLLQDAKDNIEATAFAVGTGTGQPKGVVTAVAAVPGSVVATATADTYAIGDVYAVKDALPPRHRSRASWVANESIYSKTRQFATGAGPQHAFWADLGMDTPPLLLGRPAYESSAMDGSIDAAANNYILLVGDFSRFYIVDRVGMILIYEPLVKGPNRRPTGEAGWFAYWRVGSDVVDPNAFRLLNA